MKKTILTSMAVAAVLLQACGGAPAAETYSESKTVEDGGSGPYTAIMVTEPSLDAHTIFRPADLTPFGKKNPLPILVWGNGACTNSPWEHQNFLSEIASQGFFIVAVGYMPEEGRRNYGPMTGSEPQIVGLDWAIAQNENKESPYYHKLDINAVAAAGMSCGGLMTWDNSSDPRLKTIMICNSGLFSNPGGAVPGMPMPDKSILDDVKVPVIYILGGPTDIAYENGMDDFSRLNDIPVVAINYPVGHGGTYSQLHGGEFSIPATAWLQWQLKGDNEAAKMFQSESCGISTREGWTIEKKNID